MAGGVIKRFKTLYRSGGDSSSTSRDKSPHTVHVCGSILSSVGSRCILTQSRVTGLTVGVVHIPSSDCVYANIVFPTPAMGNSPLAAATQRLTSYGSANFPPEFTGRLAREVSGAFIGGSVYQDRTVYSLNAENTEGLIALLSPYLDSVFFPTLTDESFMLAICGPDKSGQLYHEVSAINQNKGIRSVEKDVYPPDCPYHYPTMGTPGGVKRLTVEKIREFHSTHYRPNNCFVLIGGNVYADGVLEVLSSIDEVLEENCSAVGDRSRVLRYAPAVPPILQAGYDERQKLRAREGSPSETGRVMLAMPLVRFTSVAKALPSTMESQQCNMISREALMGEHGNDSGAELYDIHFVMQGPSFADHAAYTAFGFLAAHVAEVYNSGLQSETNPNEPSTACTGTGRNSQASNSSTAASTSPGQVLQPLLLSLVDRRYRLAVLSARRLAPEHVDGVKKALKSILQEFDSKSPNSLTVARNRPGIMDPKFEAYFEQLQWRLEFDVVNGLCMWSATVAENDPKHVECLEACLDPVIDYTKLRNMTDEEWSGYLKKYLHPRNIVTIVRHSDTDDDMEWADDGKFGSRSGSVMTLQNGSIEGLPLLREKEWGDDTKDQEVERYIESLGGRIECANFLLSL